MIDWEKCLLVSRKLIMTTRRALLYVPFMLCMAGLVTFVLPGCRKKKEAPPPALPANSPEVYMKDPVFRKELSDKRKERTAIAVERQKLVARMEELIREHGEDKAVLEKIPEWNDLYKQVEALNAKYEAVRKAQLAVVSKRLNPEQKPAPGRESALEQKPVPEQKEISK